MPVGVVGVVITRFEDLIIGVVDIVVADVVVVVNLLVVVVVVVNILKDSRNENLLVKV